MEEEVGDQLPILLAAEGRKEYSPGRKPWVKAANDLARIIHIFEDNKSLLCYKHVD